MYVTQAYDKELDYNYLTLDNNAKVTNFSSQTKGCPCTNVLSQDRKSIWLSEHTPPQFFVIDFGNLIRKPKTYFKYFGIYCWHAYATNPKIIELQFSKDSKNFQSFGRYEIALKPGTQLFEIKNNKLLDYQKYRYAKFIFKESYAGARIYVNNVYMFEELSGLSNTSTMGTQYSDNKKRVDKSESQSLFINPVENNKEEIAEKDINEIQENILNNDNLIKEKDDNKESEESYDPKKFITNKKLKKIENILKNKIKSQIKNNKDGESNVYDAKEVNNYISYENHNDQKEDQQEETPEETPRRFINKSNYEKKNKFYNGSNSRGEKEIINISNSNNNSNDHLPRKNSTLSNNNKINIKHLNYSCVVDNEYKKLENQLKDMEDHLKSMDAEYKIDSYRSFGTGKGTCLLGHSKSFSFLNNRESVNNPFIDYSKPFNYNKENNLNTSNPNINILNNYLFDNDNNNNKFNNYDKDNIVNNRDNNIIENKINKIEEKLINFEKDITELKTSISNLVDNINKLIDGGFLSNNDGVNNYHGHKRIPSSSSSNTRNNNYNTVDNNEIVSLVLNECNKMINERLAGTGNTNYNQTYLNKQYSSAKRSVEHDNHTDDNYYAKFEKSKLFFN